MATEDWIPIHHFHMLYPKGDYFGQGLAYVSMLPFGIICAFITLSVFVRDINVISFFVGQLANETLNYILKKTIFKGHPRPVQTPGLEHPNPSSGMPSQHSQFQAFFTVFICLFIVYKIKNKSFIYKTALVIFFFELFVTVVYSRVYLRYHFWSQVAVGSLVGSVFGSFWFAFMYYFVEPYLFKFILNLKITKLLGICNEFDYSTPQKAKLKFR